MTNILCLVHSIGRDGTCLRCGKHLSEIAPGLVNAPITVNVGGITYPAPDVAPNTDNWPPYAPSRK